MPFPFTHANGNTCCSTRTGCCPNCEAKLAAEERTLRSASAAPDPYEKDLKKRREAEATALSTFEADWKAERLRTLADEQTATTLRAAERPASRPRLTAAELATFAPPDPYQPALDAMRKEQR